MIKFEDFSTLMRMLEAERDRPKSLRKHGIDLTNFSEPFFEIQTFLMKALFGTEAWDMISWYLYEKAGNPKVRAWDGNGKEICMDVESLYVQVSIAPTCHCCDKAGLYNGFRSEGGPRFKCPKGCPCHD